MAGTKRKKADAMKRIREGTLEGVQVDDSRIIEIGILRERIRVFEHNKPDKHLILLYIHK